MDSPRTSFDIVNNLSWLSILAFTKWASALSIFRRSCFYSSFFSHIVGSVFRLFWVLRFFNVAHRKKSTKIFSLVVVLLRRQPSPILEARQRAFLGVPSCVWCHTSEGFDPRLGRLRHAEGQTSHPSQQGCDYPVSLLGLPS